MRTRLDEIRYFRWRRRPNLCLPENLLPPASEFNNFFLRSLFWSGGDFVLFK
jgi:hypothetical protein